MRVVDYRDTAVLSSYAPLQIKGLDWVILSQMDLREAYEPIYACRPRQHWWTKRTRRMSGCC
jgi:hypothetical protein